ncbi:MAG: M28 family peptidase [Phycisphaerales bacterium]|jgi:aminopeptidase YwaD
MPRRHVRDRASGLLSTALLVATMAVPFAAGVVATAQSTDATPSNDVLAAAGPWRITATAADGGTYVSDLDLAIDMANEVEGSIVLPRLAMEGTVRGTFDVGASRLTLTFVFGEGDGAIEVEADLLVEGDRVGGSGTGLDGQRLAFDGVRITDAMLAEDAAMAAMRAAADASRTPLSDAFGSADPEVLEFNEHMTVLASPWMEGRLPGTRGMELAREYMEWQFRKAGLEPAMPVEGSETNGYRQPFDLGSDSTVTGQRLEAMLDDALLEFALGEDFEFTGMGTEGEVTAPVSFVGYSIDDGENGYTSFEEDTDLSGRIAVMLRFEPMNEDGGSRWSDRGWSSNASFGRKFAAVSRRNPAAVVLVNPPGSDDERSGSLIKGGTRTADFPVVMATPEAADRLVRLIDAEGRGIRDLRTYADEGGAAFHFPDEATVTLAGMVEEIPVVAENVVGLLPGRGGLEDEYIVIGGHLDHLGFGEFGSRRGAGNLHPGADDNASGSAGVMLLGKSLKKAYDELPPETPLRSILFFGFDAEESGLNGARHYVRNPIAPLSQHSLMMNFDMIGRIENRRLSVSGLGSGEGLKDWAQPFFEASELEVVQNDGGGGGSDHAAFSSAGVPVLFAIIADFHNDYHTPDDTPDKINREDAVRTVRLWHELALDAAQRPEKFVAPAGGSGDRMRGGNRLAVRLGVRSRPDDSGEGLEVVTVSEGSSAAEAGIMPGDRIVKMDKQAINSRRELVEMLRDKSPGDVMSVNIVRDAEEQLIYVTLKGTD